LWNGVRFELLTLLLSLGEVSGLLAVLGILILNVSSPRKGDLRREDEPIDEDNGAVAILLSSWCWFTGLKRARAV